MSPLISITFGAFHERLKDWTLRMRRSFPFLASYDLKHVIRDRDLRLGLMARSHYVRKDNLIIKTIQNRRSQYCRIKIGSEPINLLMGNEAFGDVGGWYWLCSNEFLSIHSFVLFLRQFN